MKSVTKLIIMVMPVLCLLLLTNCSFYKGDEITPLHDIGHKVINLESKQFKNDVLRLSTIVDSVEYIVLETSQDCIIRKIDKVVISEDGSFLFVLDRRSSKIFVFNQDGIFLHAIANFGRGPGEFLSISNFFIDDDLEQIIIYDISSGRVLSYGFNGAFREQFSVYPDLYRDLAYTPNHSFLCYNVNEDTNTRQGLWEIDQKGVFKKQFILTPNRISLHFSESGFSDYQDEIHLLSRHDNNIYAYRADTMTIKYSFAFQDYISLADVKSNDEMDKVNVNVLFFRETDDWLIYRVCIKKDASCYYGYYSKAADENFIFDRRYNDIDFYEGDRYFDFNGFTNSMVSVLYADVIFNAVEEYEKFSQMHKDKVIPNFVFNVEELDNPIIRIAYLRNSMQK